MRVGVGRQKTKQNTKGVVFSVLPQDPLVHLSEDVVARTYNIFAVMFQYAVDVLTWENESELPADLEME